ncbi:MAG: hypothetical protein ACFB9N_07220 [Geitlerinemataceae cyanobacterium]
MTPHLEAAIAAIEPLTAIERQQLLGILLQNTAPHDLQTQSQQFWDGISIDRYRATQTPIAYHSDTRIADFWPQDETTEDFLTFLQQQRHEPADRA